MSGRTEDRIRLLLVYPEAVLAEAVALALGRQPRFSVVGIATNAEHALRMCGELKPDTVLIEGDLSRRMSCVDLALAIDALDPAIGLVMIATSHSHADASPLMASRSRAWAFLRVNSIPDLNSIYNVIESVADGLVIVDPSVVQAAYNARNSALSLLTRRQTEVLSLMAQGMSNAAIARALVLEEKSVENHINAIFNQLVASRTSDIHPRMQAVLTYLKESGVMAAANYN